MQLAKFQVSRYRGHREARAEPADTAARAARVPEVREAPLQGLRSAPMAEFLLLLRGAGHQVLRAGEQR